MEHFGIGVVFIHFVGDGLVGVGCVDVFDMF
jgi:hypothetical protein